MATFLFQNFGSSVLAATIEAGGLSLVIQAGDGLKFSDPGISEEFRCVLFDAAGNREIIGVTTRSTDNFTVITRGQEGTIARQWPAGTPISQRLTKAILDQFQLPATDDTPNLGDIETPISTNWAAKHIDPEEEANPHEQYLIADRVDEAPDETATGVPISSAWAKSMVNDSQIIHVRDEKSSGVSGGSFVSGGWYVRALNLVLTNRIAGASLASDTITLPAGRYFIDATAPAYKINGHQAVLYSVDQSATRIKGTSGFTNDDYGPNNNSVIKGEFTVTAETEEFTIKHKCQNTQSVTGYGFASLSGLSEVYTDVIIRRVPE